MDEAFISWTFLVAIFILWLVGFIWRRNGNEVKWFMQGYFWFVVIFGLLQLWTFSAVVSRDYGALGFPMDYDAAKAGLRASNSTLLGSCTGQISEQDMHDRYMGTRLSKIASLAPLFSLTAFGVMAFHVGMIHVQLFGWPRLRGNRRPVRYHIPLHMLMGNLAMPGTLATLAFRSWVRTVMLMTGSAYLQLCAPCDVDIAPGWWSWILSWFNFHADLISPCDRSFDDATQLQYNTSQVDLQAAYASQYFAVMCFAFLCAYYFDRLGDPIFARFAKTAGMIAIWTFVLVGFMQTAGAIIVTFFGIDMSLGHKKWHLWDALAAKLATTLQPQMSLLALLCVLNMGFMSRFMPILQGALGHVPLALGWRWDNHQFTPNARFNCTRLLLLAGSWQPLILHYVLALTKDGKSALLDSTIMQALGPWPRLEHTLEHAGRSEIQVQLWNTSLLCIWCLFVALANLFFWPFAPPREAPAPAIPLPPLDPVDAARQAVQLGERVAREDGLEQPLLHGLGHGVGHVADGLLHALPH